MPSNLRIIRLRDFIKVRPEGDLDFQKMKESIQEIASVPGAFVDHDVLVDTRGTESHLSVFDTWEIAKDLATAVHSGSPKGFTAKIAILCTVESFDHAKFFELCAENQGLNVQAFTSFEDVFEWLSEPSTPSRDKSS